MKGPLVGIVMGSESDREVMEEAGKILDELKISYEITVSSAHRTPQKTRKYAEGAEERGLEIIIAGAGGGAHLAGAIASHTTLPVIGVPLNSSPLSGFDALLSTVQMPTGIPVATMAVGEAGAKNGALFAGLILARKYPEIKEAIKKYREKLAQ
jgi:phosphoribosylaminoimidazole carboxylase PurE protein